MCSEHRVSQILKQVLGLRTLCILELSTSHQEPQPGAPSPVARLRPLPPSTLSGVSETFSLPEVSFFIQRRGF